VRTFVGSCLLASAAMMLVPGVARAASQADQSLLVDDARTINVSRAIARIEVSAENVIDVTAPTSRSLRIIGIGTGETTLSVYGTDGSLLRQSLIQVSPRIAAGGENGIKGDMRPGGKIVAVDVQFAAVSASTLKALGFNFTKLSGDLQGAVVSPSSLNSYGFGSGGLAVGASAPLSQAFNLFLSARNRGIGAVLSALSTNGLSQLLAQPTLLARSGDSAEFNAGGRYPIPVPQASGIGSSTITIPSETRRRADDAWQSRSFASRSSPIHSRHSTSARSLPSRGSSRRITGRWAFLSRVCLVSSFTWRMCVCRGKG